MELRTELQQVDCIAWNCDKQITAPRQSESNSLCQDCWNKAVTTHTYSEVVFGI